MNFKKSIGIKLHLLLKYIKNFWLFYNKKINAYQVKDYLDLDVSKPLSIDAIKILAQCCQVFDSFKIPYSLGWGTALGIYRGGKLIAHDNDLDFDFFGYSNHNLIIEALKSANIQLARKVFYRNKLQQLVFISEDGVIIDLVFWIKKGKQYVSYCEPGYILILPEAIIDKGTQTIKQDNGSFLILSSIEQYLTDIYGLDWRTPKHSKGDWKDDCKIVFKRFSIIWYLYQKIAPLYIKLKNKFYPSDLIPESFFDLNGKFWNSIPEYDKYFLVDLTINDHEYYNVHLITARALSEVLKANPVALIGPEQKNEIEQLIRSYGIKYIVYLDKYEVSLLTKVVLFFKAFYLWIANRTKDNLLKIKFNEVPIGHLVYDEYLARTLYGTVKMWDPTLIKIIFKSLKYYYKYKKIFKEKKYELYFGVEQIYARSGMASVAAISSGVKMFLRKHGPNQVSYRSYLDANDLDLFPNHPEEKDFEYYLNNNTEIALNWSNNYIKNLFSGNVDKYDWNAQNAYTKAQLIKQNDYDRVFKGNYRYCVFIFSHVFIDAAHCYRQGLLPDYEIWLRETLKTAINRKDTLWIIKPHPSDKAYSTKHTSLSVYEDFKKYDNIRMFPENTLTANLIDKIDGALTFRGTVAGEYSCMGVPVIMAGRSMFDEGKFCILPSSLSEYKNILLTYQFKRLSEDVVNRAKVYLYVYNYVNRIDMPLLNDIILENANGASADEIYSHLSKKILEYKNNFSFSDNYLNYIIRKLDRNK